MANNLSSFGVTNTPTAVPSTSQVVIPQITVQQPSPAYQPFGIQSNVQPGQPVNYEQVGPQLNKVHGSDGAKQFPTVPNAVYALFDDEDDILFFKATDKNNYPIMLKRFRYVEEEEVVPSPPEYVTKQQYDELLQKFQKIEEEAEKEKITAIPFEYATKADYDALVEELAKLKEEIANGKHIQYAPNHANSGAAIGRTADRK